MYARADQAIWLLQSLAVVLFMRPVVVWGLYLIPGILLWLCQIRAVVWTERWLVLRWEMNWGPAHSDVSHLCEDDDGVSMVISWKAGVGFPFPNRNLYLVWFIECSVGIICLWVLAVAEIVSARIKISHPVFAPWNSKYMFVALWFCLLSCWLYAMSFESFETG